jgi:sugar/nucleoside kinase (ribokinase family)
MKIITIGAATLDVFVKSKAFQVVKSDKFLTGEGECLAVGSKNDADGIFIDTGGGATNTAVTFANFGFDAKVLTRVGKDLFGREVEKVMEERGVGTDLIQKDGKLNTSYSTLLLLGTGERAVLVYRGASNALEIPENLPAADWFYVTGLGGNLKLLGKILDYAVKKNIKVMYNPGGGELKYGLKKLVSFFRKLTVLNLNREEAALLCNCAYERMDVMRKNLANVAPYVVITDGPNGAFTFHNGDLYFAASLGTPPKNTTGAGDAFGSAFCAGLAMKNDLDFALRLAILNSDGVIRQMGAKTGILKKMPAEGELRKVKIKKE